MTNKTKAWIAQILFLATISFAQATPPLAQSPTCPPVNTTESRVGEIIGPGRVQTFYPYKKGCSPEDGSCDKGSSLIQGWPVDLISQSGNWACIWAQDATGSGQVWIRGDRVKPLEVNMHPPIPAWRGSWWPLGQKPRYGIDHLVIWESKSGRLRVHGNAYWYGGIVNGSRVVHFGGVDGQAKPNGNQLDIVALDKQGDPAGCELKAQLVGRYLKVSDNNQCGGMNVRFWGFYAKQTATAKSK